MKMNDWILRGCLSVASLLAMTGTVFGAVQEEEPPRWGYLVDYPRDFSVDGYRIDWLIDITLFFITILFVIMCVWMVWACFFHNKDHTPDYDHGDTKHSAVVALLVSSVIFLIVDGNLFVNSVIDLDEAFWNYSHAETIEGEPRASCTSGELSASVEGGCAVRVEVNARQWAWQVRYAGIDGEFNTPDDITMLNDVYVPTGAPVIIQLGSPDVIHSFYLPNFRVKMDAMPGMINRMWFQAREDGVGEYDIGCAQHCGTHHYKMKGKLTVLPPEEFKAWAEEASKLARQTYDPNDSAANWGWDWSRGGGA